MVDVLAELADHRSLGGVPDFEGAVVARGQQLLAAVDEADARHLIAVPPTHRAQPRQGALWQRIAINIGSRRRLGRLLRTAGGRRFVENLIEELPCGGTDRADRQNQRREQPHPCAAYLVQDAYHESGDGRERDSADATKHTGQGVIRHREPPWDAKLLPIEPVESLLPTVFSENGIPWQESAPQRILTSPGCTPRRGRGRPVFVQSTCPTLQKSNSTGSNLSCRALSSRRREEERKAVGESSQGSTVPETVSRANLNVRPEYRATIRTAAPHPWQPARSAKSSARHEPLATCRSSRSSRLCDRADLRFLRGRNSRARGIGRCRRNWICCLRPPL